MNLLLRNHPPGQLTKPTKEFYLWWAVIQQAAKDIDTGHEQRALDAYEFLSTTGLWLLTSYFNIREDVAIEVIADVVRRYNARAVRPLPIR